MLERLSLFMLVLSFDGSGDFDLAGVDELADLARADREATAVEGLARRVGAPAEAEGDEDAERPCGDVRTDHRCAVGSWMRSRYRARAATFSLSKRRTVSRRRSPGARCGSTSSRSA